MTLIEWVILTSVAGAIVSLIMTIVGIFGLVRTKKKLTKIKASKPQTRKAKGAWRRQIKKNKDSVDNFKRTIIICLLSMILVSSVGGYIYYYQMTNLTKVDTDNIVSGYYLLDQIEEQLALATKEEADSEQVKNNIHTIAIRIASFSAKKGNDRGSREGQQLLNRYYAKVGQFGINLSSQSYQELVEKPSTQTAYLEDIKGILETQKKLLDFYTIDEASLREKK